MNTHSEQIDSGSYEQRADEKHEDIEGILIE
jgi:hypothetical protein